MIWLILLFLSLYLLINTKDYFKSQKKLSPVTGAEPVYEPKLWNDNKNIQYSHNCYSYFLNDINQDLTCLCKEDECKYINPQPGHFRKKIIVNLKNTTCPKMIERIASDNDSILLPNEVDFKDLCPNGYYKGALAVDPENQYHFYRQDQNGLWSHKDGGTPATNLDASSNLISDPKNCDRNYKDKKKPINYKDFCGYFCIPNNLIHDTNMSRRHIDGTLKYLPQGINYKWEKTCKNNLK
jgi:hypothetical protein